MKLKQIARDVVINCKTLKEAEELSECLKADGFFGVDYIPNVWNKYESDTCYYVYDHSFCSRPFCEECNVNVIDFSDLIIRSCDMSIDEVLNWLRDNMNNGVIDQVFGCHRISEVLSYFSNDEIINNISEYMLEQNRPVQDIKNNIYDKSYNNYKCFL